MPTSIALFLISSLSVSYSVFPSLPPFLNSNTHFFFLSFSLLPSHSLIHSLLFRTLCHSDSLPPSHAPSLSLSLSLPSSSLSLFPSFPFRFSSFLFLKRYRYPPLCLNCRSRDSRPRRARLRGLPPAILPTQQQQSRFTSLIPRHLSSLETNLRDNGIAGVPVPKNSRTDAWERECDRPLDRLPPFLPPFLLSFRTFPNSRREHKSALTSLLSPFGEVGRESFSHTSSYSENHASESRQSRADRRKCRGCSGIC